MQEIEAVGGTTVHKDPTDDDATSHWHRGSGAGADENILTRDPFVTLDIHGVGELVRVGTQKGREARPSLKVGICGEHGGDPESVAFCDEVGLDYVSCSPFRVPIARLSAAQAAIVGKNSALQNK